MLLLKRCGAAAALSTLAAVTAFAAGEGEAAMAADDVIEVHTYDTVSHSAGSEAGTAQQVLDDVQAYIEEHTGVRVFTHRLPRQTYQEQVTLLLASNDPMDVIAGIRVADFQPKGALKAINQWFDQIPNTRKAWTDIAWAKVSTTDGQTWAIPRGEVVTAWPVWIRGEFLRQYGLEYPTTVDELEQVLEVFKQNDPIGGGQTQVMVTSYAPHLRMVMAGGWLPDGYGPWLDSADGKVKPPELHPGFEDFIARMRDWYAKGYIWPDSFTIPASEVRPVIYQGQFASTAYWTSAVGIGKYTILKNFPDADPVYQRPIMGPAGMIETLNPAGTHGWVFPARSPDANTEAMLKVFEWQYSDVENYITGQDGIKGQHWQWVEEGSTYEYIGNRQLFEDYRFAVGLPVEVQARVLSPEIEFWSEYLIHGTDDLDAIKHPFDVAIVWDMQTINDVVPMTDLKRLWDSEPVKFITGQRSMSEWSDFQQEMRDAGVDKWIDEYTRQYNAMN